MRFLIATPGLRREKPESAHGLNSLKTAGDLPPARVARGAVPASLDVGHGDRQFTAGISAAFGAARWEASRGPGNCRIISIACLRSQRNRPPTQDSELKVAPPTI